LESCQRPGFVDCPQEQAIEGGWRGTIQHKPDVIVGGDRCYAEQGLAVGLALAAGQRPLMRQE
jgi:hypothetical protein